MSLKGDFSQYQWMIRWYMYLNILLMRKVHQFFSGNKYIYKLYTLSFLTGSHFIVYCDLEHQHNLNHYLICLRFLDNKEDIAKLRKSFAGLWSLDNEEIVKSAIEKPDLFVLKPQREGGGMLRNTCKSPSCLNLP